MPFETFCTRNLNTDIVLNNNFTRRRKLGFGKKTNRKQYTRKHCGRGISQNGNSNDFVLNFYNSLDNLHYIFDHRKLYA